MARGGALPGRSRPSFEFLLSMASATKVARPHCKLDAVSVQKAAKSELEAAFVDFQHWGVEMFTTSEKIGFVMRHLHLNASRPLEVELRFHICTFSMCECKTLDWALLQKHLQILEGHRDRFRLSGSVIGRCHVMD